MEDDILKVMPMRIESTMGRVAKADV